MAWPPHAARSPQHPHARGLCRRSQLAGQALSARQGRLAALRGCSQHAGPFLPGCAYALPCLGLRPS
eukprot:12315794-Alexandrium_andersonii.AAC.1